MKGGSYRQCDQCGKRALSIATRCPGCGREFPDPIVPESGGIRELRRFLTPGAVAAVLAAAAVLALARFGRISPPPEEQSAYVGAESIADLSEVESSGAWTAPVAPAAPPSAVGELRVARTWTNVRKWRSVRAPLEAMLLPGDTVLADSLERDWYRVALEGEVLGYAHRSTLESPGAPPTR